MAETEPQSTEGGFWGCVVVFAAFFIQVAAFGTSQSIGVYNIEFLRYFDAGAAAVSLVGSINLGMFLGAGPLASVLMSRWSHRQVALVGAGLANFGLIFMPFSPNLPYMYVFYGLITGLGYSLVYVPSHVLSGLYFCRHQSLATGIATAGSGMGATLFPIIMYYIIQYYGWRGSLYIIAGLNMHLFVFAALLRPVPPKLKAAIAEKLQKSLNKVESGKMKNRLDQEFEIKVEEDVELCELKTSYSNGSQVNGVDKSCSEQSVMLGNGASPVEERKLSKLQKVVEHLKTVFKVDFIIYWFSNVCWNAGGAVILIFYAEYAVNAGLDKKDASTTLTVIGAGACIGCVLGGLLGNIKYFDRIAVYILGNIGAGVVTILITWKVAHNLTGFVLLGAIFGLMFGIILGLLVVVTIDLLGMEALGDGFGFLMLANGVGVFGGPPIAGLLIDTFHSMDQAMVFSGVLSAMGGVVMCLVPLRRKLQRK